MGVLLVFWVLGRLEFAKMRYDPSTLAQQIKTTSAASASFKTDQMEGKTLHYVQVGENPQLPTIVLVHGSPGALNAYEKYLSDTLLQSVANLIAVDRPGFGYSDFGRSEKSLAVQAQQIARVLKQLPSGPKLLLGHSMGGPVISKMAMEFPEVVDALLLVAPSISPELEPSNTWRKLFNWLPLRWLIPPALRVCNQEIIPLREELEWMMADWEALKIPVTVVQGSEDVLVPQGNADFAKKMLTASPSVKIQKIEGGDHFILWSEIPLIRKEVLELLAKISS